MGKFLSIIIPAYNRPESLKRIITSIKTFLNKESVEIIVSDDSTNDLVKKVFYETIEDYDGKYIVNKGVHAPGPNRQNGLNHAHGRWVMFIDDDDDITENISAIVSLISSIENKQIIMIRTNWYTWETNDTIYIVDDPQSTLDMLTHGKIYLKSFIDKFNIHYSLENEFHEDVYFNYQFYAYLKGKPNEYKELQVNLPFYKFLNNPESISRREYDGTAFDRAIRKNPKAWIESYTIAFSIINNWSLEEKIKVYDHILERLVYITKISIWLEDKGELDDYKKALFNNFFMQWSTIFPVDEKKEVLACINHFYENSYLYDFYWDLYKLTERVRWKEIKED